MSKLSLINRIKEGNVAVPALIATAIFSILALVGINAPISSFTTKIIVSPEAKTVTVGETLNVDILVESQSAVNVFSGVVNFDPNLMQVENISYNTSIADLWTEKPWFKNGDGTINFAGGTTVKGGFVGQGVLMSVTFLAIGAGEQTIKVSEARILAHDGFGSDTIVDTEAIFLTIKNQNTLPTKDSKVVVLDTEKSFDLNNDGKVSLADATVFLGYMMSSDTRADFNTDGKVGPADLSLLFGQF